MGITLPALTPAQESLFLTLAGRAFDSRLPRPFLGDPLADEILTRTGYDLHKFPNITTKLVPARVKVFDMAVRTKRQDEVVRAFVERHPDAVVLDMGVGLDTRAFRVDPPSTVDWYDIDFPAVMRLRRQLVPERANTHQIAADLTEPHWLADIPDDRPAVLVGDGLVGFLTEDGFVSLLRRLTSHFPSGELTFNQYTTGAVKATKRLGFLSAVGAGIANPGFNDPRQPERWAPRLTLVEEIFLTRAPEVTQLGLMGWLMSRLFAPSTRLSRQNGTVVLRYRF